MGDITPCSEKGYKEGDLFVTVKDPYGSINDIDDPKEGDLVKLVRDDKSTTPFFEVLISRNPQIRRGLFAMSIYSDVKKLEGQDNE